MKNGIVIFFSAYACVRVVLLPHPIIIIVATKNENNSAAPTMFDDGNPRLYLVTNIRYYFSALHLKAIEILTCYIYSKFVSIELDFRYCVCISYVSVLSKKGSSPMALLACSLLSFDLDFLLLIYNAAITIAAAIAASMIMVLIPLPV